MNFTLKYTLSSKILSNLAESSQLYGRLEALRIPKKLELNLERKNLVNSSYISNSIEGNPLSLPEVTNLLLSDRIPANRDEKEVKNYFDILKNLPTINRLDLPVICELHKKLMRGVDDKIAGNVRNREVVVGSYDESKRFRIKHNPPFHDAKNIKTALTGLFDWINKNNDLPAIIKAGLFHHEFVYIHPFVDGNGRVCRLSTALIFLQNNFQINKYFVLDDWYDIDRFDYSDKLHTADSGDKTEWLEYFTDGVKYSLQSALAKIKNVTQSLSLGERLSAREKEVLTILQNNKEITSAALSEMLKISRQQAHVFLKSLFEKGFIDKKGSTKNSYYFLK
ncbi:Fic family protein [Candidatus Collierbacteria bacterium]|nr:Fic family protein [Candidatus Collierbacteria bacterium]